MADKEISKSKSGRDSIQQQLADIYFTSSAEKPKLPQAQEPVYIKVIERPSTFSSAIPWIITCAAFLITAFSLFSSKRVFVDIHIVDEKTPYTVTRSTASAEQKKPAAFGPARRETSMKRIPMHLVVFEGAAALKSAREKNELQLVNSSVAPFARAAVYFDPPLDLMQSKIVFQVKGAHGGEQLAIAVKDSGNMQAFEKGKWYPFLDGLGTNWQRVQVPLEDVPAGFDKRNVSSLRFEFGSKETENKPGDTIDIKDLQVVRYEPIKPIDGRG